MSADDAFLKAIIESPDDDTPRLIYADWLDEHGQPERAEFIRVQCELASMPQGGGLRTATRRWKLQEREHRLLAGYKEEWVGPLRAWVSEWEFRRGFTEAIAAPVDLFLTHAEDLFRAAPIRHVTFQEPNDPTHWWWIPSLWHRLADCPYLARLSSADFRSYIMRNDAGVGWLWQSPHLSRLRSLGLFHTRLGEDAVLLLAVSPNLSGLTSLQLGGNRIEEGGAEALACSPHLTNLVELDLRSACIGERGVQALAASPTLSRLTLLNLAGTDLGDVGALALAASPHLARLESLGVRWTYIGREAEQALWERFGDRVHF